ncbi:hypothetical protein AB5I41_09490 [Sphingomonas sp. MMS24-JH45]
MLKLRRGRAAEARRQRRLPVGVRHRGGNHEALARGSGRRKRDRRWRASCARS